MRPFFASLFAIVSIIIFTTCSSDELQGELPEVTTVLPSDITINSASSGGNIFTDGGKMIIARGIVWSTSQMPTVLLITKTNDGTGNDNFTSSLTGLNPNTKYYVRAYATNSVGTAYGNELSFKTNATSNIPRLSTTAMSSIMPNSAVSGGVIMNNNGAEITAKGVVWNTSRYPTVSLETKTSDGEGSGVFTSSLTGLNPNTIYYIRAYATNSAGTAYGNELSFRTTNPLLPTLITTAISSITYNSAVSGGVISSDGGDEIKARGVVWSTSFESTISLITKTNDGTGSGAFTSSLTGLNPNTIYYIRAYATNSAGTAYGNVVSFTTVNGPPITDEVTDIDGNVYQAVTICSQTWITKNLNVTRYRNGDVIPQVTDPVEWSKLTTGAWCYYENQTTNGTVYGKLYNWYAVTDPRGLAPRGYHVPSKAEWATLANCLGGVEIAGGKMKEAGNTHWLSPNTAATNSSGFTGLPGGFNFSGYDYAGFYNRGYEAYWWGINSTIYYEEESVMLNYNTSKLYFWESGKVSGLSVRCIKD